MLRLALSLLIFVTLIATPAHAQTSGQSRPAGKTEVDVELVFLADASGSIDEGEIRFQRKGYADAMQHRDVLNAISRGLRGRIAVTFMEWGDDTSQEVVVPWMMIDGADSAKTFATRLMSAPRRAYGRNAIGSAIAAGQTQIETNAFDGFKKVIDFSGDSANSWSGPPIEEARQKALAAGIIINGLPILCREDDCGGRPVGYDLERAFATTIIGGPGSFVVTVDSAGSFAEAVRRKLILELASAPPPADASRR